MALSSSNGTRAAGSAVPALGETSPGNDLGYSEYKETLYVERQAYEHKVEAETVCVFQAPLLEIALDMDFKQGTYRLLFILLAEVKPANYIDWSAHALCKKYNMSYSAALAAWKVLTRKGWLRPVYNEYGRVWRYRLSPHLCWRGRPWKARTAQKNWDAEAQLARLSASWDNGGQT